MTELRFWEKNIKERELTLDCVQHSAVQRLTAGVIGGGTDAGTTAVCQCTPVDHTETES